MEYKGNLFGKVGKHYFPLEKTTDYVEKLEKNNKEMLEFLEIISNTENIYQHLKDKANKLIKEATEL